MSFRLRACRCCIRSQRTGFEPGQEAPPRSTVAQKRQCDSFTIKSKEYNRSNAVHLDTANQAEGVTAVRLYFELLVNPRLARRSSPTNDQNMVQYQRHPQPPHPGDFNPNYSKLRYSVGMFLRSKTSTAAAGMHCILSWSAATVTSTARANEPQTSADFHAYAIDLFDIDVLHRVGSVHAQADPH